MPCYDGRDRDCNCFNELNKIKQLEAMLCAAMTFIESDKGLHDFFQYTNWQEVGVSSRELASWWSNHVYLDQARKRKEQKAKEAAERMSHALEKAKTLLSREERYALGIKD